MSDPFCPVRQVTTNYENGYVKARSVLSPTGFPVRALVKIFPKRVIPVVFLPGIMGTNLRLKQDNSAAWHPPNDAATGIAEVVRYLNKDVKERMALLHPDLVEVDASQSVTMARGVEAQIFRVLDTEATTFERLHGWGELHQASYSSILNNLQSNLHNILDDQGNPSSYWQRHILNAQGAEQFGAEKEFKRVTPEELKRFAAAAYPVHAIGYNWLQSNNVSVLRVAERIEEIVGFYRDKLGRQCDKVILVTHSMGGLVGRALTQLQGSKRVLGVLHGVMPAVGAPATYKRMRAGFEGVAQALLGRNGAETTAILGQSPGPLELLPSAEYQAKIGSRSCHWLRASFVSSRISQPTTDFFLGPGEPYDQIYLNKKNWWRLVKTELLQPVDEKSSSRSNELGGDKNFRTYERNLERARVFHNRLAGNYHPNTYAFYAADPAQLTWGEVRWVGTLWSDNLDRAHLVGDDLNGSITVKSGDRRQVLTIAPPDAQGDGTVPEASGAAPKKFVTQIFRHEGKKTGHPSYEHQFAYGGNFIAGLTLYSIVRLTLDSHVLDYPNA